MYVRCPWMPCHPARSRLCAHRSFSPVNCPCGRTQIEIPFPTGPRRADRRPRSRRHCRCCGPRRAHKRNASPRQSPIRFRFWHWQHPWHDRRGSNDSSSACAGRGRACCEDRCREEGQTEDAPLPAPWMRQGVQAAQRPSVPSHPCTCVPACVQGAPSPDGAGCHSCARAMWTCCRCSSTSCRRLWRGWLRRRGLVRGIRTVSGSILIFCPTPP